jgi:hypothetical protein
MMAVAGLFVGGVAMPSAKAADLGGDCCADLEERVAELEATTARKGNRKMGLTVTGQVNRVVIWYDDGKDSKTYYGLDNTNSSSRFIFNGSARVTPKVTMGFEIMLEIEAGGTSSKVSQFDEDGKNTAFIPNPNVGAIGCVTNPATSGPLALNPPSQFNGPGGPAPCPSGTSPVGAVTTGVPSFNQHNVDAYFGDARRVAWWVEHADLGRLTVGRWESAGVLGTIDITGQIFLPASASFILLNGGMFIRGPNGQVYNMTWANIGDPAANNPGRTELVRYDSASWNGFIYSASINEAGDYWGTMLRYAGEHHGFRIAGTVGYERITDIATPGIVDPANAAYTGNRPDITVWGAALSVMHVPTGLFVQGHYNATDYGGKIQGSSTGSGYWGESTANKKPADQWIVQAGIQKNWFGYGNTAVYGEYGKATDWGADITCGAPLTAATTAITNTCAGTAGRNYAPPANTTGFTGVFGVTNTELTVWGAGVVQSFSAAATDLYVGYRHMDADITCTGVGANCSGNAGGAAKKLSTEGIDVIVMGARVLF